MFSSLDEMIEYVVANANPYGQFCIQRWIETRLRIEFREQMMRRWAAT